MEVRAYKGFEGKKEEKIMAYMCTFGDKECDGCGECQGEITYHCPVCGRRIDETDYIYVDRQTDEILGCQRCVRTAFAGDYKESL